MKFALKNRLFCKVIVGYENKKKEKNNLKKLKSDNSKNISRNLSGAVVGSMGSVQF